MFRFSFITDSYLAKFKIKNQVPHRKPLEASMWSKGQHEI